eukprot:5269855-Prymnesium_polylepis.1
MHRRKVRSVASCSRAVVVLNQRSYDTRNTGQPSSCDVARAESISAARGEATRAVTCERIGRPAKRAWRATLLSRRRATWTCRCGTPRTRTTPLAATARARPCRPRYGVPLSRNWRACATVPSLRVWRGCASPGPPQSWRETRSTCGHR